MLLCASFRIESSPYPSATVPIVKKQIGAKQFTQDIIDTLGKRLFEVMLPIPKNAETCRRIAEEARRVIETRVQLRNRAKEIALEVEGIEHPRNGDLEAIEDVQNEN